MADSAKHTQIAVTLCILLFVGVGSLWISQPGLSAAETQFAAGNFYPQGAEWSVRWWGTAIPLMEAPSAGSLKAWLYTPIFAIFPPSAASVRLPMVLAGAATLWLVFLLLRRIAGARAGSFAVLLLTFDPVFLWATRCDFGPSALSHLLTAGALYAFAARRFAFGGLLLGLALWDQTAFLWVLAGLAAGFVWLPPQEWRPLPGRTVLTTAFTFCAGALPAIVYWIGHQDRIALTAATSPLRLIGALGGNALFGFLTRDLPVGPKWTAIPLLLAAAVVALPWLWRTSVRRPAMFFLTLSLAGIAATVLGGHEVTLLWPWPQCFLALAISRMTARTAWITAGIAALSCASVTANVHLQVRRFGANPPWSDAVYQLSEFLQQTPATRVFVTGRGIVEPLRLLSGGRLPLDPATGVPRDFTDTEAAFVRHAGAFESIPGLNAQVDAAAAASRPIPRRKVLIARIRDSRRVDIFEVYRFVPIQPE